MDVLLVSTPPGLHDEFGVNLLQMELTAAYLGKSGFSTEILECTTFAINTRRLVNLVLRKEFCLLGCFTAQNTALSTLQLVRKLRDSSWCGHISLLGDYASKMYRTLLGNKCGIDSIVIGRDDLVLAELAKKIQIGELWADTAGLAYYQPEQGIIVNHASTRCVDPVIVPVQTPSVRKIRALTTCGNSSPTS